MPARSTSSRRSTPANKTVAAAAIAPANLHNQRALEPPSVGVGFVLVPVCVAWLCLSFYQYLETGRLRTARDYFVPFGSAAILVAWYTAWRLEWKRYRHAAAREAVDGAQVLASYEQALLDRSRSSQQIYRHGTFQRYRTGGKAFDNAVVDVFNSLFKMGSFEQQRSVALALVAASGVGKTFSALCFPSAATNVPAGMIFLVAYIGFNTDPTFELTEAEKKHLLQATGKAEPRMGEAVAQVILARLFASIVLLIKHHDYLEPAPGSSCKPTMRFHHAHPSLLKVCVEDLMSSVISQIVKLAKQVEEAKGGGGKKEKRVGILVNLDEAQFLDEITIDKREQPQGARLAMGVLRTVQHKVFLATNGGCVVLGLATGINPQLVLASKTTGTNKAVTTELLSRSEFAELTHKNWPHPEFRHSAVFAAAVFPRVREMLAEMMVDPIPLSPTPRDKALELVRCALLQEEMKRDQIPTQIYATSSGLEAAVPVLDLAVWPSLMIQLGLTDVGALPCVPTVRFDNEVGESCFTFEDLAFQVFGFTLGLFWHPCAREIRNAFIRSNSVFEEWVDFKNPFTFKRIALANEKLHYHPFLGCTTHEEACNGQLSTEVHACISKLSNNHALLLWTGGSAPVDYVLLICDHAGLLHARYVDAKHCSTTGKQLTTQPRELSGKARMVHRGLQRCLGGKLDPSYTVAIVTNMPPAGTHVDTDTGKVYLLGPGTFEFSPWSDLLFRAEMRQDKGVVV